MHASSALPQERPILSPEPIRRYDIDWLRVMAVFLLFFFHSARIFDSNENFYVHRDPASPAIGNLFIRSMGPWHMSLFFLLAGASSYYALCRRSGREYVKERFKRLFLPFVFGLLVLIPPQSYLGLRSHSGASISFFSWYPQFFALKLNDVEGYFMGGHTWGHLWFIIHLFVYSLIAVGVFIYLKSNSGQRATGGFAIMFANPIFLLLFPFLLSWMRDDLPSVAGGPPFYYLTIFICGYFLVSDPRFAVTIDRWRVAFLILGPFLFAILHTGISTGLISQHVPKWVEEVVDTYFDGYVPWFVLLALLGYGKRLLNFSNGFLTYFAEASYPLYILHQTVIVILGYYIVKLPWNSTLQFSLIVASSFVMSLLIYDLVIRRNNVTRFVFGMKIKKG